MSFAQSVKRAMDSWLQRLSRLLGGLCDRGVVHYPTSCAQEPAAPPKDDNDHEEREHRHAGDSHDDLEQRSARSSVRAAVRVDEEEQNPHAEEGEHFVC